MLQINPGDVLVFTKGENSSTVVDITSTVDVPVLFKIQTTSPDKFCVRPRLGVLLPKHSVYVNIVLKAEHHLAELASDKFLIMGTPSPLDIDLASLPQIGAVWKEKPPNSPDIELHRLCCVYRSEDASRKEQCFQHNASNSKNTDDVTTEFATFADRLERQQRYMQLLQYLTLFVLMILSVAVVYLLSLEIDFEATNSSVILASKAK